MYHDNSQCIGSATLVIINGRFLNLLMFADLKIECWGLL